MFSHCASPAVAADPCAPRQTDTSRLSKSNYYQSSLCYRPLQQLYKTMYSPVQGTQASPFNRACICRPSERYTTTNMTYGSFYYNNWSFIQKNRSGVARCEDQMKKRDPCNNGMEGQVWSQTTSDACCPTVPCHSMLV